ncbi:hypothetical protein EON65_27575 [archaeon]|nr:MAG: hypothetical protein EON65_27575 [archaeon]
MVAIAEEAPLAPALAKSHWPIAHASTWNSDYTSNTGPTSADANVQLFMKGETIADLLSILETADPITLVQSSVEEYTWGSSISSVFQTKIDENGLSVVNTLFRDYNFEYHGAYSLLAHDGTYYAATKTSIQAYNNQVPLDFSTPIVKTGEFFIPSLQEDEHIVGLTVTHDAVESAYLIFATSAGGVGGVSLDLQHASNVFYVPGIDTVARPNHFVSNSIAMSGEDGGIFVCTSYSLARLNWDPVTRSISLGWNSPYGDGQDDWYWGRLGPGCGTSPTIVGPNGKPEFVVINDGETPMHVLFFDAYTGALAGKQVVSFGSTALAFNSTTDQSITVKGYKAVLVNNWVADEVTPFCSEWFAQLPVTEALKHECPYLFGAFVNGVEQFEIDPKTHQVRSVWANPNVSCTSSIPVVSEDDILYCLGKRRPLVGLDMYTIEALDWNTGKSLFHVDLSHSLLANSLYSATEIGTQGDIVMGTLAGLVRVSSKGQRGVEVKSLQASSTLMASTLLEKWSLLDKLAELHARGEIPSADFLKSIKFAVKHK